MVEMSTPFKAGDDYIINDHGEWIRFPTYEEAWEFYNDNQS